MYAKDDGYNGNDGDSNSSSNGNGNDAATAANGNDVDEKYGVDLRTAIG